MYTVDEVIEKLNVSKLTIYSKLKKYKDRIAIKQGKSYVDEELLRIIKKELKVLKKITLLKTMIQLN